MINRKPVVPELTRDRNGIIRANAANVRRLRPFTWGDFKHKLAAAGIIASVYDDVPTAWRRAYINWREA